MTSSGGMLGHVPDYESLKENGGEEVVKASIANS